MSPPERVASQWSSAQASKPEGPHALLTGDLSVVVGSLHDKYDDHVGAAVVETEIQEVADRFTDARIRSFVPLFVRRFAGAKLRDHLAHPAPSVTDAATATSHRG
jgi:hypothetical protein